MRYLGLVLYRLDGFCFTCLLFNSGSDCSIVLPVFMLGFDLVLCVALEAKRVSFYLSCLYKMKDEVLWFNGLERESKGHSCPLSSECIVERMHSLSHETIVQGCSSWLYSWLYSLHCCVCNFSSGTICMRYVKTCLYMHYAYICLRISRRNLPFVCNINISGQGHLPAEAFVSCDETWTAISTFLRLDDIERPGRVTMLIMTNFT